jgi:transcriptional regulator with XRE-family HTH domain
MEQRIKVRLAVLGKNAGELAQAAGISGSALSDIMGDKADPRLSTLAKVEDALGVPRGWLTSALTVQQMTTQAGEFAAPEWAAVPT